MRFFRPFPDFFPELFYACNSCCTVFCLRLRGLVLVLGAFSHRSHRVFLCARCICSFCATLSRQALCSAIGPGPVRAPYQTAAFLLIPGRADLYPAKIIMTPGFGQEVMITAAGPTPMPFRYLCLGFGLLPCRAKNAAAYAAFGLEGLIPLFITALKIFRHSLSFLVRSFGASKYCTIGFYV